MVDVEKVIKGLECCNSESVCYKCPYVSEGECEDGTSYYSKAIEDAIALLHEQEPHLITTEDFVRADHDGYLAVWAEERNGDQYWKIIPIRALEYGKKYIRYWSSRPTNEQREAVKWE